MEVKDKPPYWKPQTRWNQKRRCKGHHYDWTGKYLITMVLNPGVPYLSTLTGTPKEPLTRLSAFGAEVGEIIRTIPAFHPQISILNYVLMPDHVHILMEVHHAMPKDLGFVLGAVKGACSRALARLRVTEVIPAFEEGFNDRIIYSEEQLAAAENYIRDNPRRLLIKWCHPELFQRLLHIQVGPFDLGAYGNVFLLRDFQKMAVAVHRGWTLGELEEQRSQWLACARNRGVLVSPFISQAERQVRDEALELGGKIIRIQMEGFPERFKPGGREFQLCSEGRLLLLSPWQEVRGTLELTRDKCLRMNWIATQVAAITPGEAGKIIAGGRRR